MSLAKLSKISGKRVMGIDASTQTIAYAIVDDGVIVEYGEIFFKGDDLYDRILDAKRKIRALKSRFKADFVAIEAAVMVRSVSTGLKMAYMFGAIMGELLENNAKIIEVHPLEWQGYIGNPNFTKAQKAEVKKAHPDKSETWIKSEIRKIRKQKTISFMSDLGVKTDSDNVADAAGIAWFAYNNFKR